MQKPKRLLILTYGNTDHPSSRIRAVQYIPLLEAHGAFRVKWIPRIINPGKQFFRRYVAFPVAKRRLMLYRFLYLLCCRPDIIFVQRVFLSQTLLRIIAAKKIKLVYDFDDAIYLDTDGRHANHNSTAAMLQAAAHTIVSSDDLLPFAGKFSSNISVIPSPVDMICDPFTARTNKEDGVVTVGWIGSGSTAKYLKGISQILADVAKQQRFKLLVVGAGEQFDIPGLDTEFVGWSLQAEKESLLKMDIGIMPLPDNEWTRGKGGYKLNLYASAGLPLLASPVGINRRIVKPGFNGYLAATEGEWNTFLSMLIENEALRRELGQNAWLDAKQHYSREVCFKQLLKILDRYE